MSPVLVVSIRISSLVSVTASAAAASMVVGSVTGHSYHFRRSRAPYRDLWDGIHEVMGPGGGGRHGAGGGGAVRAWRRQDGQPRARNRFGRRSRGTRRPRRSPTRVHDVHCAGDGPPLRRLGGGSG